MFIGSASEGKDIAQAIASGLAQAGCEPTVWDQNVFRASSYTLQALLDQARRSDFAVLVATPDDVVESRGVTQATTRDNVVLEFGLFAGVLGIERVYLLATEPQMKLPTDLLGLTRLPYTARVRDANLAAAVGPAVAAVKARTLELKIRPQTQGPGSNGHAVERHILRRELDVVAGNARDQGWRVKTNSETTLRLESARGRRHTFQVDEGRPRETRLRLRLFVTELRASGLRVNASVRREPAPEG
ncbi:hypothetical protein CELL_03206 [Cellulomonas sp. T2.31MG-18]